MADKERRPVGLTEAGIRLYLDIRAAFLEFARAVPEEDPETGEPMFEATEASLREAARRWEALWARAGLGRNPAREEALMELALRPRSPRELYARLFRKARLAPDAVRRAVPELMEAGLVTDDLREVWVE